MFSNENGSFHILALQLCISVLTFHYNVILSLSLPHKYYRSGVGPLHDPFSLFLVQCIIILSICRVLGLLAYRFKQPKVIFEIIGKIDHKAC